MSLEQAIATLITEVASLTAEMRSTSNELRTLTEAIAVELHKGDADVPAKTKPKAAAVQPAPEEPASKAEERALVADEPDQPTITDTDLKNAFVQLVNKNGREAMTDILTDFGATKFSELPKDRYAEIGAAIAKAMG